MKIRSDMNARTAMVYGGAAFLLVIVGFRSVLATLDPDDIGFMTYLSSIALILEFSMLLLYAYTIYNLGPDGGDSHGSSSGGPGTAIIADMDKKGLAALTRAVDELQTELKSYNDKMEEMSASITNLVEGQVREEIKKEVNEILTKAISK